MERKIKADGISINWILDKSEYPVELYPASRERACPVSPGYLDTGHYRYTILICVYLSLPSSLLISGKKKVYWVVVYLNRN
jgi:hypothetical protein